VNIMFWKPERDKPDGEFSTYDGEKMFTGIWSTDMFDKNLMCASPVSEELAVWIEAEKSKWLRCLENPYQWQVMTFYPDDAAVIRTCRHDLIVFASVNLMREDAKPKFNASFSSMDDVYTVFLQVKYGIDWIIEHYHD